ncbi:MAG: ATP-binding protein, partial [Bacteroidota bacterium]
MESIGTLAGGIAHDFNNILGIILGHILLLRNARNDSDKVSRSLEAISEATGRATDLVRQILVFARKSEVLFMPLDANQMVTEIQKMIQGTFPKTITVSTSLETHIPMINADRTQIHQILLNLCVNARDAMPDGGTLSITTRKVTVDELRKRLPDAQGTEFLNISVRDTGTGIDEATMQKMFEPFFTTKEQGKGTGLGLAVVYGIIRSHHGYVDVQSTPGKGSTFDLFFPVLLVSQKPIVPGDDGPETLPGGTETILVIEDEDMLRELTRAALEAKGYGVITASDGADAVKLYKKHFQEIALVISDLGLPKLDGTRVFNELRKINPGVKVVIATGYIEPGVKSGLFKAGAQGFLQKPYKPAEILKIVREVLDAG